MSLIWGPGVVCVLLDVKRGPSALSIRLILASVTLRFGAWFGMSIRTAINELLAKWSLKYSSIALRGYSKRLRLLQSQVRVRNRRRFFEVLESRLAFAIDLDLDSTNLSFKSDTSDDLYLQVVDGVLKYSTDGSSYISTGYSPQSNWNITYRSGSLTNALYLTGMDQGTGAYITPGALFVSGNLNTQGTSLALQGLTIDVGNSAQSVTI